MQHGYVRLHEAPSSLTADAAETPRGGPSIVHPIP